VLIASAARIPASPIQRHRGELLGVEPVVRSPPRSGAPERSAGTGPACRTLVMPAARARRAHSRYGASVAAGLRILQPAFRRRAIFRSLAHCLTQLALSPSAESNVWGVRARMHQPQEQRAIRLPGLSDGCQGPRQSAGSDLHRAAPAGVSSLGRVSRVLPMQPEAACVCYRTDCARPIPIGCPYAFDTT
jgi:hypothetical protein